MAEQFANDAYSPLAANIDDTTTTVTVSDGSSFPANGTFRIKLRNEIMRVTARSGDTLTVVRGQEGTTAVSHATGADAIVKVVVTAAALAQFAADVLAAVNLTASALAALGLIGLKPGTDLGDADGSVSPDAANLYTLPAGVDTAARTTTLSVPTDKTKAHVICIVNRGATYSRSVTNGGLVGDALPSVAPGTAATFVWEPNAGGNTTDWHPGACWVLP